MSLSDQATRAADFNLANSKAGILKTSDDAVWHHLDDYNLETGEITLELVYKDAHRATSSHASGCLCIMLCTIQVIINKGG